MRCWNGCGALTGRIPTPDSKPAFCSDLCARSYVRRRIMLGKDTMRHGRLITNARHRVVREAPLFGCQARDCKKAAETARLCLSHYMAVRAAAIAHMGHVREAA